MIQISTKPQTRKERRLRRRAAAKKHKEMHQLVEGVPYVHYHVDHLQSASRRLGAVFIYP